MFKLQIILFAAGLYTLDQQQEGSCSIYPPMSNLLNYDPLFTETQINELVQGVISQYPSNQLTIQVFFSAPINVGSNYYQDLVNSHPGTIVNLWGNNNVLITSYFTQS